MKMELTQTEQKKLSTFRRNKDKMTPAAYSELRKQLEGAS